jgi:Na+-transporting methylmalonyl-CoA/oxaloacetate decarboxylase gamma subunit
VHLVAIAWIYVVGMMALAEALSTRGSVLGGIITFVFYGLLPLAVVMYLLATPARKKMLRAQQEAEASAAAAAPDGSGHPAAAAVAPERKEG